MQPIDFPTHTVPQVQAPGENYYDAMYHNARQTRIAVQFIAWVVGLCAIVGVITGIYIGIQLASIGNTLVPSDISTCQSLGGSDPSC